MISRPLSVVILVLSLALIIYSVLPLLLPKAKPEKFEIVWSDDTYCRFNTVFGGTDINKEISQYFANNPTDKEEMLLELVTKLKGKGKVIDKLEYTLTEEENNLVPVIAEKLNKDLFKETKHVVTEDKAVLISIIDNYYPVYWSVGTNNVYVKSEKYTNFTKANYVMELLHVGSESAIDFYTNHAEYKKILGFNVVLIGEYR